jgi:cell division protein FtsQ
MVAISGLLTSLSFVSKNERNIVASDLQIIIHNNDENFFLDEAGVRSFFEEANVPLLTEKYQSIDLPEIEKSLNNHPAIENAEVSADLNGAVKVEITQRTPIVRVINKDGESYYIDSKSKLMPLNENYTARVLVATGEIFEPYSRRYQYPVDYIRKSKLYAEISLLDDILEMSNYINNDSCLSKLIHQLHINIDKEFELMPAFGNHKILFGDTKNMELKFNKLKIFYAKGLNSTDAWSKYASVNLKYKNLVVCTKK